MDGRTDGREVKKKKKVDSLCVSSETREHVSIRSLLFFTLMIYVDPESSSTHVLVQLGNDNVRTGQQQQQQQQQNVPLITSAAFKCELECCFFLSFSLSPLRFMSGCYFSPCKFVLVPF